MLRFIYTSIAIIFLSACALENPPIEQWEHSNSGLYAAAISENGKYSVISSFREGVSYWNLEKQERLFNWSHGDSAKSAIAHVAFSPNGTHVITADQQSFVVWDTKTGKALGYWSVDADIMDVAISNNGKFVLLGLKDGRALHINQQTQRRLEVIAHREEHVTTVALTANGKYAITGGDDHRVVVWNAISGKEHHTFELGARVKHVSLDHKHPQLFIATENKHAYIFKIKTGETISQLAFKSRQGLVSSARFSPDGKTILIGFPGRDISLWDITSGKQVNAWRAPNRKVGISPQSATIFSVAIDSAGKTLLAQASNGLGAKWNIENKNSTR